MAVEKEIKDMIEREDDDWQEEEEFIPCDKCDGHPACEDFGCAILAGLGKLLKTDNPWDL